LEGEIIVDPIQPVIVDNDIFLKWQDYAHDYMSLLTEKRENAVALLAHKDPVARCSAIRSFKYLWHFDLTIVDHFVTLATQDSDPLVRYTAAATMVTMHLRSKSLNDRLLLEQFMNTIVRTPGQMPEIIEEVLLHLRSMGQGKAWEEMGPD
jgi:hypothetical protein